MAGAERRVLRCAIYTRKSSEEGLEQDFNSLDAQREGCEAYIRSQAGEGWKLLRTAYDDGGYSGGSMGRPALARLLADIRDRKLDTVVVYKVDRLTRSLTDFAKIVEVFDTHGVSFVSVTQQFNTTTSMGRLTLNMLLSFAQFEREVTGERIRDKIAASKRKGMWMGGFAPLGYEPNGRTLAIHASEAETVRAIFRLYLELGNVRRMKEEADRLGLVSKLRPGAGGRKMRGGNPLSRGHIYDILSNPLYVGRIAHKGETYEGQHPAIIDPEVWEAVQSKLAAHTPERSSSTRVTDPSLLKGKLFDAAGVLLTPSHAVKSGRRYRYYVSRELAGAPDRATRVRSGGWRLPANEIERFVRDAVTGLLADRAMLTRLVRDAGIDAARIPELISAVDRWTGEPLDLVRRVEVAEDEISVLIDLSSVMGTEGAMVRHLVPARIRRRGVEMRLVLENGPHRSEAKPDGPLVKAVVRAHRWFDALASGRVRSLSDITKAEGVSDRYVTKLLPLACLAPEIVASILQGTQPVDLTAEALSKRVDLPLDWREQKAILGFDRL